MSQSTPPAPDHFVHRPHAWIAQRKAVKPPRTDDERLGINGRIGVFITTVVGTMWAAYLFTILALVSAPAAFASGDRIIIVAWIAQTFLQLVLLPIIIVGENVQARASDKRSAQTYSDAEAILQECLELQKHLEHQDEIMNHVIARLERLG